MTKNGPVDLGQVAQTLKQGCPMSPFLLGLVTQQAIVESAEDQLKSQIQNQFDDLSDLKGLTQQEKNKAKECQKQQLVGAQSPQMDDFGIKPEINNTEILDRIFKWLKDELIYVEEVHDRKFLGIPVLQSKKEINKDTNQQKSEEEVLYETQVEWFKKQDARQQIKDSEIAPKTGVKKLKRHVRQTIHERLLKLNTTMHSMSLFKYNDQARMLWATLTIKIFEGAKTDQEYLAHALATDKSSQEYEAIRKKIAESQAQAMDIHTIMEISTPQTRQRKNKGTCRATQDPIQRQGRDIYNQQTEAKRIKSNQQIFTEIDLDKEYTLIRQKEKFDNQRFNGIQFDVFFTKNDSNTDQDDKQQDEAMIQELQGMEEKLKTPEEIELERRNVEDERIKKMLEKRKEQDRQMILKANLGISKASQKPESKKKLQNIKPKQQGTEANEPESNGKMSDASIVIDPTDELQREQLAQLEKQGVSDYLNMNWEFNKDKGNNGADDDFKSVENAEIDDKMNTDENGNIIE